MPNPSTNRARLYVRISKDRPEEPGVSTIRQEEACRAYAERHGLEVVDVYRDDDISASTYARRARPAYLRLVAEVRPGETILAAAADRLSRSPSSWQDLLLLAAERGVRIVTLAQGEIDVVSSIGKFSAAMNGALSALEVDRLSERVLGAKAYDAKRGRVLSGGAIPFGYAASRHPVDGHLILAPDEAYSAPIVRFAARRIGREGGSAASVVRELFERGVPATGTHPGLAAPVLNRAGTAPLRGPFLADKLHRAAIAGFVEHDGERYEAEWEALISLEEWEAVLAQLGRNYAPRGQRKASPLSGLVFTEGGTRMRLQGGSLVNGKPTRWFSGPGASIQAGPLETIVVDALLLATDAIAIPLEDEAPPSQASEGVARLERRLADLARRAEAEEWDEVEENARLGEVRRQLRAARDEVAKVARRASSSPRRSESLAQMLARKGGLRKAWEAGELSEATKREALAAAFDRIVIRPGRLPLKDKAILIPSGALHAVAA